MIRPELRTQLHRWREALIGIGISGLGLWLVLRGHGLVVWLGGVVILLGGALALAGLQMGRFRGSGEGPGVVTIDERRVAYFGPLSGGVADLDLLARLELLPDGPAWRLTAENGEMLDIPTDARGAERLLDVFAALPGLRIERLLSALNAPGDTSTLLWRRPDQVPRPRLR
ncbi:MAG: hypothetical protein HLUCCA08_00805 [Rhodobacteraceae bacterium HLUCCA08]|nr:MAG: hypothetical protein HLUCCA08_00805 [Rhodobacteraceae bacterium HLUCCA08]